MKLFASLSKKALVSILVVLLPILITFLIGYRLNKAHLERFVENNLIEEGIVAVGVREMLIGASIGFIAVAGLIGMLLIVFHRKVVVPLRRISTAADDIGQERFDISLPVQSDDEIGALAESFNNMAKKIEEKNREVNRLSAAFEHSVNVLFITNINGVIEYVNPMFETVTGWSKEEAIGKTPAILSSGETTRAEYEELWKTITAGKTWRGAFKNKRKDGRPYWGNGVITPIKDERGKVTHFLAVQEDITEKKMADERVQYLVTRDNFTGLLNRTRFIEVVSEWIYNHQNVHQNGALLLVNVDGFKDINDTFGHGIGDELIRYVAKLLEDTLVGADIPPDNRTDGAILGRLGGDEFAVFLPDVDTNMGMETAERIRKSIEEFRLPALAIQLTVSIGVVSYPEHGKSSKELFTKVDAALYHAKTSGRNRCHLYRPEDRDMENIRSRIHQKQRIIKALGKGAFFPGSNPYCT